jgi:hypothetical protein
MAGPGQALTLEPVMPNRLGRVALVVAALLVAACGGSGFSSATYGYSLTPPSGWTTVQAQKAWDGAATYGHDSPEADQIVGPATASSWAVAVKTDKDLATFAADFIAANAKGHGNTCPPQPEAQDSIKVGGDPGTLIAWNCGILINGAVTLHKGRAYIFGLRDPAVHAATDAADRATFLTMLESVRFPN